MSAYLATWSVTDHRLRNFWRNLPLAQWTNHWSDERDPDPLVRARWRICYAFLNRPLMLEDKES